MFCFVCFYRIFPLNYANSEAVIFDLYLTCNKQLINGSKDLSGCYQASNVLF